MHLNKFTRLVVVGDGYVEGPCKAAKSWETRAAALSSGFTLSHIKDIVLLGSRRTGMLPKWPPGPFL